MQVSSNQPDKSLRSDGERIVVKVEMPSSPTNRSTSWQENFVKLTPIILSIFGFLFGIYQFNSQQNSNAEAEFNRRMFEKALQTYSEINQIVGQLSTINLPGDSTRYDSLTNAFFERYWGAMLLVEEESVRQAMRELAGEINDVRMGEGTSDNLKARQDNLMQKIRQDLEKFRAPH